ncbi:MAG TPA: hypothetical protein VGR69_01255 [Candidatus Rubrimentiphilum sp.]|nr:hypothetical protein [Candidatus Rubrimentiphilum sp.]
MKHVFFIFLAFLSVVPSYGNAAGKEIHTRVNVSGVSGRPAVFVEVSYREIDGYLEAQGHEVKTIHGNGSVTFTIPSKMNAITVEARVEGCGRCRVSKRFNSVPTAVGLHIP